VWDRLVPALAADPSAHGRLTAKLRALALAPVTGAPASTTALTGRRYTLAANPQRLEALALTPAGGGGHTVTFSVAGVDRPIVATPGAWHKGTLTTDEGREPVAASGAWTAADIYTLKVSRYHTPFVTTYRLRFTGDDVAVEIEQNVGPADQRMTSIRGTAAPAATGAGL
jgi:hypothetical protein